VDKLGLYVHVPFCAVKCPYCDFYSLSYRKEAVAAYVLAASADLRETGSALSEGGERLQADTLYFGGGTPGLLPPEFLGELFRAAEESFSLSEDLEFTLETNPNIAAPDRLAAWREIGVNRLSVGMQSAQREELSALGRRHSPEDAARAVRAAAKAGIANLSLDIMLGIPGQTPESLRKSLEFAVDLPVTHISLYILKAEPGTPYWGSPLLSRCMGEDALADAYLSSVEFLEGAGYRQYEIANFSLPGWESRHNLKYWRCQEYLGFGPGAHSFYRGRRTAYSRDLLAYTAKARRVPTDENAGGPDEQILLGLRLREGIPLFLLRGAKAREKAILFCRAGYAAVEGERLHLTPKGFLVSNELIVQLLEAADITELLNKNE